VAGISDDFHLNNPIAIDWNQDGSNYQRAECNAEGRFLCFLHGYVNLISDSFVVGILKGLFCFTDYTCISVLKMSSWIFLRLSMKKKLKPRNNTVQTKQKYNAVARTAERLVDRFVCFVAAQQLILPPSIAPVNIKNIFVSQPSSE